MKGINDSIIEAAASIRAADGLLFTAGAGMGVDSGLPDFRGDKGFWKAYPAFEKRGLSFMDLADPRWFVSDPATAWGFYGHRLNLYRQTIPHKGCSILLKWGLSKMERGGYFVKTTNVDGQFEKAGFASQRINACHGSIHRLQCNEFCPAGGAVWSASQVQINVSEDCQAVSGIPLCPYCGAIARPNILMFGDSSFSRSHSQAEAVRLKQWLEPFVLGKRLLTIVEIGAGEEIPTLRLEGERLEQIPGIDLIRINPREFEAASSKTIVLPMKGLEALQSVEDCLLQEGSDF